MSALGISAHNASRQRSFVVSAYADVRHEHLYFERQQSHALRQMEWDNRLCPPLSWSALILRIAGALIAACAALAILT
jgi:hypothetical protein